MPTSLPIASRALFTLLLSCLFVPGTAGQGRGPMPVGVSPVVERNIPPSMRLVGTIRADRSATVATEVSGIIASFAAEEGQFLAADDVICRLDPAVVELRLAQERATLAGLQAQLEELQRGERPEEIQRLEAVVKETEADLNKWAFERKRVSELFERGQSSDKEQHDTEMEYLAARSRLTQAEAALQKARNGPRVEKIARAKQAVVAQQSVVQRLERDRAKTEIRAPFAGELTVKRTEVGEWIDEGGDVCDLIARERVRVRADVPESAVAFAKVGAETTIEIEALRQTRTATISRVIPQAIPAARTFPVEIDLPNEDHSLLPGMFVWAYVPAGPAGKRMMVSPDAIVAQGTQKSVFVVREQPDGTHLAVPLNVRTGLEVGGLIEVQSDALQPGDRVVARANERLRGPTPIIPQPVNTALPPPRTATTQPTTSNGQE